MTAAIHSRPLIIHVSGDFPDPVEPFKTPVIRTLIDLTGEQFEHRVISLNRATPTLGQMLRALGPWGRFTHAGIASQAFDYGIAVEYAAPPKGMFHKTMLVQLGTWLARELAKGPRPALIVAHKLSIEGLVVERAAALLGLDFAISIQGDTDTKIVAARPDLTKRFSRIFHKASMVFPFAPWALHELEKRFGPRQGPVSMLPCPTDIDTPTAPRPGGRGLISVFHLKNYKRKNLPGLSRAVRILSARGIDANLTVVGGGSAADRANCASVCEGQPAIHFSGAKDRTEIREDMGRAAGFVMPSLRESFGLVFIEALFCGLPIIYPRGAAVDGFLDGLPFAIKVDARDPEAVADAMQQVLTNEASLKAALAQWQASDDALRFTRQHIAQTFADGLRTAITPGRASTV